MPDESAEPPSHEHVRRERLREAAIDAEFETGRHEDTVEEARRQLGRRLIRLVAGAFLSVLGLVLIPLPGPGLVVLALGLSLLAQDVPFANNLLHQVRSRMPEDEDGNVPLPLIVFMALSVAFFTSLSIWWAFFR